MPLALKDLHTIDESGDYIFERNVDIPLPTAKPSDPGDPLLVRQRLQADKGGKIRSVGHMLSM